MYSRSLLFLAVLFSSIIVNAQKKALEMMKPGVTGKQIHTAVDEFINKSDFKGCFIHSTGHSLGLGVHDVGAGWLQR